jgi:putative colanic acid biosynthesis acetyltransferase WcaB
MRVRDWARTCARDLRANSGYPKSQFVLLQLRTAQLFRSRSNPLARVAYLLVAAVYKITSEWVLGIEIPVGTTVGPGLRLRHGVGLVVNPHAVIGANVLLRHGVTIGNRRSLTDCPTIGDDVEIGAGATLIGGITVGRGARIGAGVVLVEDMPDYSVAYLSGVVIRPGKKPAPATKPAIRSREP